MGDQAVTAYQVHTEEAKKKVTNAGFSKVLSIHKY